MRLGPGFEEKLHIGDCPMTNHREDARTSCVCDEHPDEPRDYIEGGGGWRYTGPRETARAPRR